MALHLVKHLPGARVGAAQRLALRMRRNVNDTDRRVKAFALLAARWVA